MASPIVKEGFQVEETTWGIQRPPLGVKTSALNEKFKEAAEIKALHGSVGINGLLKLCNIKSTCQVSMVTDGTGQPKLPASSIVVAGSTNLDPRTRRLIRTVSRGLRAEQEPEAAVDGLGGTYFFMNESGERAALMKPCDEEPLAPNNPKGFVGRQLGDPGMKPSVKVGEAAIREVAAYLMDHDHRANVPATVLVEATHSIFHVADMAQRFVKESSNQDGGQGLERAVPSKLGSLQQYTEHLCDSSEVGASRFNKQNVHRIGILDLRLLNTDRHAGNLLVRKPEHGSSANIGLGAMIMESNQLELIPIDHGFCLPDNLEAPYFEWLHWPQAMMPFDEEELEYIASLDAERDIEILRLHIPMLRESCLRMLWISTLVLKRCAAAGMTLSEIGTVYSRPLVGMDEEPSELERLCHAGWQHVYGNRLCNNYCLDEDGEMDEEEEECYSDQADEYGDAFVFDVSDSASSHPSPSQRGQSSLRKSALQGALAGRPAEVERCDSPDSECALSGAGSLCDLQFILDEEKVSPAACLSLGSQGLPSSGGKIPRNKSLNGESDSWSLAAFSVSSLSVNSKPVLTKGAVIDSSEEELLEHAAFSLNPVSELSKWRRHHPDLAKHKYALTTGPRRRQRANHAPTCLPASGDMGSFGDLDEAEWEIFIEGVTGHLDAALQAGIWKAAHHKGSTAARNLFGSSAPC